MNSRLSSLLSLTLPVVVIWGLNFAVIRVGVAHVGPFTLAALRFATASLPLLWFVERPPVPLPFLLSYGLLFGVAQFTFLFIGMTWGLASGIASLLLQLQAVFTPLLALLLLKENFTRYTASALGLSLAGLAVIISSAEGDHGGIAAVLLGVSAALCWAMSNVVVRFGVRKGYSYKPLSLVVWASFVAVGPFVVLAWASGEDPGLSWEASGSAVLAGLYLGILGTIVAYVLWVRALSLFDAGTVAPFSLLIPILGLAAGALIFGERLTTSEIAGSLMIVAGVIIHIAGTTRSRSL
ncbi:EamA family transporter [Tianweitania sediminis]|uniref:EamA family transporter n=1 Tax=Tianweitania sediminis TaxID=1502156 RepID=A0A8J7UJH6_9HYPH|nr:EamA family transporter [Tianweitania sediminis]MBP0440073.1 EamA family transporter [Tianweitania sediminis]